MTKCFAKIVNGNVSKFGKLEKLRYRKIMDPYFSFKIPLVFF